MIRTCLICSKNFATNYKRKVFCSKKCQKKHEKENRPVRFNYLSTGTVGAIGELKIGIDLLSKGWEVYRALSPSSSCDLIALKGEITIKIEVRTGQVGQKNQIIYPKNNIRAGYVAVVVPNKIIYIPDLPIITIEKDGKIL